MSTCHTTWFSEKIMRKYDIELLVQVLFSAAPLPTSKLAGKENCYLESRIWSSVSWSISLRTWPLA
jgi:hypothetical protein